MMKKDTEAGLKGSTGALLGALLGAGAGLKFPSLAGKFLKADIPERAAQLASSGVGSMLGASAGNALSGNNPSAIASGELGLSAGGALGALASVPFIRANPKGKLLKYLLGTSLGASAGAGLGAWGASDE